MKQILKLFIATNSLASYLIVISLHKKCQVKKNKLIVYYSDTQVYLHNIITKSRRWFKPNKNNKTH